MSRFGRVLLMCGSLSAVVAALILIVRQDLLGVSKSLDVLEKWDERRRDMEAEVSWRAEYEAACFRIAEEVIEGRLTLLEAGACVRDARGDRLLRDRHLSYQLYPDLTNDELDCRKVILVVRALLDARGRTEEGQVLARRLLRELHDHLCLGTLTLPRSR